MIDKHLDWWRGSVIYQVYPRSFFDSNGSGTGDLIGITNKLEYIASLGVDAIWLCPFFTSPHDDFGYDVADHVNVDPTYGTLHDFDALIARAHDLGLKVIIDQVWSHTSNQHPWFVQSRVSRHNAKADWFVWADPAPDGTPPNNWLAVFGGSAWTWEPRRRQYYLHHFLPQQPALNYENPEVIDAVLQTGRFWLDRGVDGFRLDAIDFMTHDPELRNNPSANLPHGIVPAKPFGMQEHRWDVLQPSRYAVYEAIRGLMNEYPGTTTLGEVSSQPGALQRVLDYTHGERHFHMAYTLSYMRGQFDWSTIHDLILDAESTNNQGHICWSFSNHDTVRAISRWKPESACAKQFALLLMHLLLALPGSVSMYQGEELGLTEAALSFEQLRDPFGIAYWPEFKGRDGSRTPMPWTESEPTVPQWLPISLDHLPMAVSVQESDPSSLLYAWRAAIAVRKASPALKHGTLTSLDMPEPCIGFIREHDGLRVACLFNLGDEAITVATEWFTCELDSYDCSFIAL